MLMKTDGRETSKLIEDQFAKPIIDTSRRSLTKAGVLAPVIMTLASKTALGSSYDCTISGMQSGNMSSHPEIDSCGQGISPANWKLNASQTGSQDGNIHQWFLAGINPFSIKMEGVTKYVSYNGVWVSGGNWDTIHYKIFEFSGNNAIAEATTFKSIFGGSDTDSIWDKLYLGSGLEYDASVDYLNAKMGGIQDISPLEVIALYNLAKEGTPFIDGGMTITNQTEAAALLARLHL